jgi:hypothetical protein
MPTTWLLPSGRARISRHATISPQSAFSRPAGSAIGLIMRFGRNVLRAMRESRSEEAQREIHRLRHLIPGDAGGTRPSKGTRGLVKSFARKQQ